MARVPQQKSARQIPPSNVLRGPKVSKQRNKHKVVLETVGQQSRKVLSFNTAPPAGYTFIPAGNPELTAALKEFAKKGNHQIYAVSATPHASRHELSREVHRVGFHFPTEVVARVCAYYGIRLTSGGKLVEEKEDDRLFMRLKQRGLVPADEQDSSPTKAPRDQVTINTEAKQIITDLFPNIPDNDLFQIIKTAFQLGDHKVGTAAEIPLVRRAQLSVVAHIRHTYTSYDQLLKQVPYTEARHRVESETLQKLIAWRGDDDDKQAVEDTLREVVVISDEEDSSADTEDDQLIENGDLRVQLVSEIYDKAAAAASGARAKSPIEIRADDEPSRGHQIVSRVIHRHPITTQHSAIASRQDSRYAVWDRHRQQYLAATYPQPTTRVIERTLIEDPISTHMQAPVLSRAPIIEINTQRRTSPPVYVRAADGRLYERIVVQATSGNSSTSRGRIYTPPGVPAQTNRSVPASPPVMSGQLHQRTQSLDDYNSSVVPSVEGVNGAFASPRPRRNPFEDFHQMHHTRQRDTQHLLGQQPPIEFVDYPEHSTKRRRINFTPPLPDDQQNRRQLHAQDERQQDRVEHISTANTEPIYIDRPGAYDSAAAGVQRRDDAYSQVRYRDQYLTQSPRTLQQLESPHRAITRDTYPVHRSAGSSRPYEPMREAQEHRVSGTSAAYRQEQPANGYADSVPVRYVFVDGQDHAEPARHRVRQVPFRPEEPREVKYVNGQYLNDRPAQPLLRSYPSHDYR